MALESTRLIINKKGTRFIRTFRFPPLKITTSKNSTVWSSSSTMILALVLLFIAVAVQPSFSYPLGVFADSAQGFDITTDFDPYYGPFNYGNRWWGGGNGGLLGGYGGLWGGSRGLWPYDGYADNWDYGYGYGYDYPVRTVDVGRDRLVRDFAVTETDNWVRDQTSFRAPTRFRSSYYGGWPRRVISAGFGGPRTSSLRTGGDMTYLRR